MPVLKKTKSVKVTPFGVKQLKRVAKSGKRNYTKTISGTGTSQPDRDADTD